MQIKPTTAKYNPTSPSQSAAAAKFSSKNSGEQQNSFAQHTQRFAKQQKVLARQRT